MDPLFGLVVYVSDGSRFVLGVLGTAAVAGAGAVAVLRRGRAVGSGPGRWRAVLLVGLALAGLMPALWWWGPWRPDASLGYFGDDPVQGAGAERYNAFVRAVWASWWISVAELVGFAAVVAAAVLGRGRRMPRRDGGPP